MHRSKTMALHKTYQNKTILTVNNELGFYMVQYLQNPVICIAGIKTREKIIYIKKEIDSGSFFLLLI